MYNLPTVLIVEDEKPLRKSLELYLSDENYTVITAQDGLQGIEKIKKENPDLILCDLKMPRMDGYGVLEAVKKDYSHIPIIIMTGFDDAESTIKAMKKGATEFETKPLDIPKLKTKIANLLRLNDVGKSDPIYLVDNDSSNAKRALIGKTPQIREIYKHIGRLAVNRVTVLVEGASGTGKELVARLIHENSSPEKPFVAINCSAISETLLESELFGHVKGAFTDAFRDKKGKFEQAKDGTIFLDEISELSFHLQAKLLRVLQEKEFERVGSEETIQMNARVISATNKDLRDMIVEGAFREDLYYRLNVFGISIPSLRERKEDIPILVNHFINRINVELFKNIRKIPYETMELLQNYEWPGNIRELENVLRRAAVLCKNDILDEEYIKLPQKTVVSEPGLKSLTELEKEHLHNVLNAVNWNISGACDILGISKPTLYNKMKKYKLKQS